MSDIFTYRHGCDHSFATYKRGTTRIDYMLATNDLLPFLTSCGYLEFDSDSDHRSMFADFHILEFLQALPPPEPITSQSRTIYSRNKKQSRIYKARVLELLTSHNYAARLNALTARINDTEYRLTHADIRELETIDTLITQCMLDAEEEQFRTHDSLWSPYLIVFIHTFAYWAAWISELRTQKDLSRQRAYRLEQVKKAGKDIENATETPPQLQDARKHRRTSRANLRDAMNRSQALREEWLLDQEDLAADAGDKQRARMLRNIRKSEIIRQTHATVRTTLSGRTGGALSSIIYMDDDGTNHTTHNPTVMAEKLIQRNLKHFHQADGTVFTSNTIQDICKAPLEQALPHLKQLTGADNTAFDEIIHSLEQHQAYPDSAMGLLNGHDIASKFSNWRESTSTSPSKRHLGLYRAIRKAPNPTLITDDMTVNSDPDAPPIDHGAIFFQCIAAIINICVLTGYVLNRWKTIVSVMLEKIPSMPLLEKLRVIHLFEADFNAWTGIVFGRRMMRQAELLGALGEEQGGSRKGRSAVDVYAMKFLSFQTAELTRTSLAVMDNDAKACYDRIVMALATKRCEALGVPHAACRLFENFLDTANYHVSTHHGVSQQSYTSSPEWQLHGPGQGNQSSPVIWAVVSTLILNTMKQKFKGTTFCDPQQHLSITHHMQAFVDDSSIWVNNFLDDISGIATDADLLDELQKATSWWEQLLAATGGKLELSKCFFYFLQWKFRLDGEPYLSEDTPPHPITVRSSLASDEETISHKNPYEPHRTLGFQAQPINDYRDQLEKLQHKSQTVLRALYSQKLDANTALNAYHSVFVPRIGYVFPFCGLTARQLNTIQSGPLAYTLQAMGYPKTFPRAMVFMPRHLGGIGFNTLFTEQGMANVQFILRHIRQQTDLGTFLLITFRWMQLTAGTSFNIFESNHQVLPHLPSKWITQLRQFLHTINGQLIFPDEPVQTVQREHDQFIMDLALKLIDKPKTLVRINRVRIFLRVTRLSDISNLSGTHLAFPATTRPHAAGFPSTSNDLWPKQLDPGKTSWRAWRMFLNRITLDDQQLRQPLGKWTHVDPSRSWTARFDYEEQQLYVRHPDNERWIVYIGPTIDSRGISLANSVQDTTTHCPDHSIPVEPSRRRMYDFNFPYFTPRPPTLPLARTWDQFLDTLPPWEQDLLRNTIEAKATERLLNFIHIPDRTMYIVSDGGCKNSCGSFGWVIATETEILWKGWGTARGVPMSSYRAEAYGRLACVRFLIRYLEFLSLTLRDDLEILTWCDNEGLLTSEKYWRNIQIVNPYDQLHADADAVQLIVKSYLALQRTANHAHVKGHQDDNTPILLLPWPAQLNIAADKLATFALRRSAREQQDDPIPLDCTAYLVIDKQLITSKYKSSMHRAAGLATGTEYLKTKLDLPTQQLHAIDWEAHRRARDTLSIRNQAFVTKQLCNWLPTNSKKALENPAIQDHCIHCPHLAETISHIFRCPALHQWRHDLLHQVDAHLLDTQTPDELHHHILHNLKSWLQQQTLEESPLLWLKGCIPKEWTEQIDRAYFAYGLHSHTMNGAIWAKKLCQLFMTATHHAWTIRSSLVTDEELSIHDAQTRQRLRQEITDLYALQPQCILKYPFSVPLQARLLKPNEHLSAWLTNHKANLLRSHTKWQANARRRLQQDIRSYFKNIGHR